MLFCPTNLRTTKTTFDFLLRNSDFYFLFSVTPHGFLLSVCPLTKPLRNLSKNNSPTDLEKQTAIASKDYGIFFLTKPLLCQIPTMLVKTLPVLALLACMFSVCGIFFLTKPLLCQIPTMLVKTLPVLALLLACLVCVCALSVCVCVCYIQIGYPIRAIHATHANHIVLFVTIMIHT